MRPIESVGARPGPTASVADKVNWCMDMIDKIVQASRDESSTLAQPFEITNNTATRALDPTTATTNDVAKVLATLITDMKRGGKNRVR